MIKKLLKGPIDFHLQNPNYYLPVKSVRLLFFLYPTYTHNDNKANLIILNFTLIPIIKKDWKNKFIANPLANQNIILRMLENMRIPQMSIEKDPICFLYFINEYWEYSPMRGMNVITIELTDQITTIKNKHTMLKVIIV